MLLSPLFVLSFISWVGQLFLIRLGALLPSGIIFSFSRNGFELCCLRFVLASRMSHPVILSRLLLGFTKKHGLERGLELYCSGFILDRGRWSLLQSHLSLHCIFSGWPFVSLCFLCSDFCLLCTLLSLVLTPSWHLYFFADSACYWFYFSCCSFIFIGVSYEINKFMVLTKFELKFTPMETLYLVSIICVMCTLIKPLTQRLYVLNNCFNFWSAY